MECSECRCDLVENEELSCGMGNQKFMDCPDCGRVLLVSGEIITQVWEKVIV